MIENAAAGPRSNCPSAIFTRSMDSKRGRVAGATAGYHERLGVNHETVHEAQQDRDHQHAHHFGSSMKRNTAQRLAWSILAAW